MLLCDKEGEIWKVGVKITMNIMVGWERERKRKKTDRLLYQKFCTKF